MSLIDWWWNLSGVTWVLVTFVCGSLSFSGLGLLVIFAARSITQSFDHDAQTCPCHKCEGRRARYLNAQARSNERHTPTVRPGMYISTVELRQGMIVIAEKNANAYEFLGMRQRSYGYTIILRNLETNRQAWIVVPLPRLHARMWKIADTPFRRLYGL